MFVVLAMSPCTSTRAVSPNSTPLGLINTSRPFEVNWPRMEEGLSPVTRLRVKPLEDGS